jgi:hypothetical protein
MTLEALWTVDFGAVGGGVIVLKSGQIFGGDGARYYLGTFTAKGTKLEGQLSIAWYFGPRKTVWGDEAKVAETKMTGEVGSDTITGNLTRAGYPAIPFHMTKRADLPSEP